MTDKQFIEMLRNIQDYCHGRLCSQCMFDMSKSENTCEMSCALRNIAIELSEIPEYWNITKIKRILKEYE